MRSWRASQVVIELLPEIILAGGLTFFLLDEFDAATSALSSERAILLMLGTSVLWIAARLLTWRFLRWRSARLAAFGAAALAVLAVVVLPAYDDMTVIETFPAAEAAPAAATSTTSATTTSPATTSPPTTEAGDTIDRVAPPVTAAPVDPPTTPPPTTVPALPPSTAPAAPVAVRRGELAGIDHRAEGDVVVYRDVDGTSVVGLESIDIQPGPDYDVYVVAGLDRHDVDGGIRLDDLRGNIGTQFYRVPAGTDLTTGEWTVMVWCETFDVPIANATPTA